MDLESIIVQPSKIWDFFLKKRPELKENMLLVAENEGFAVRIYITENEEGNPQLQVYEDDVLIYDKNMTRGNCERLTAEVYNNYLTANIFEILGYDDGYDDFDSEELEIEIRESELDDAFFDLMCVVADETIDQDVLEDIKEHTLEYIFRKHGIEIRRPMKLYDEDGEFYEEYPYDCMVFDDEDNPIYS